MANVTVHSTLMLNTGELVDLSATLAEGTEGEVTTSQTYSVSAVSLGQFADGKTITSVLLPVTAPNGVAYAYICLLYTSPSPRDGLLSRMPSSA